MRLAHVECVVRDRRTRRNGEARECQDASSREGGME